MPHPLLPDSQEALAPRRSDARRNVAAIVAAARSVLAERPRASVQDIADAAGLHRATVHRHFSSRDDLLAAVREDVWGEAAEAYKAILADDGPSPVEKLERYTAQMVALGRETRAYRFLPFLDAEHEAQRTQDFGPMADLLAEGQRLGQIRADVAPMDLVLALAGMITTVVPEVAVGRMAPERGVGLTVAMLRP
jgi:AcrR family transcriptional regulator